MLTLTFFLFIFYFCKINYAHVAWIFRILIAFLFYSDIILNIFLKKKLLTFEKRVVSRWERG